jgi:hypothetical protein
MCDPATKENTNEKQLLHGVNCHATFVNVATIFQEMKRAFRSSCCVVLSRYVHERCYGLSRNENIEKQLLRGVNCHATFMNVATVFQEMKTLRSSCCVVLIVTLLS